MAATTPWITGLTTMGWSVHNATAGSACIYYPVNDAPPFNIHSLAAAPGRRWVASYMRQQNRYAGSGTGGASFNVDLTGQSALTTGYWYGHELMSACGFLKSGTTLLTLALGSPNIGDANLDPVDLKAWYPDESTRTIATAVGGCTINIAAGEIPNVTFDMVGIMSTLVATGVDMPIPGTTAGTVMTPPFGQAVAGCTFTLETYAYVLRSLTISTSPQIAMRRSVAGTNGYAIPTITGYECTAVARVELDNRTYNPETSWVCALAAGTAKLPSEPLELSLVLPAGGSGTLAAANTITITGDFLLDGQPQRVDDGEGILCLDIPLLLDPTSIAAAADDADTLKIVWSD